MSSNLNSNQKSIFLIGPMGVGKSTLSKELSQHHIPLPVINVDKIRWKFFETTDYSKETEFNIARRERFQRCT